MVTSELGWTDGCGEAGTDGEGLWASTGAAPNMASSNASMPACASRDVSDPRSIWPQVTWSERGGL